jgi:iron complex outermembrane receptor protein
MLESDSESRGHAALRASIVAILLAALACGARAEADGQSAGASSRSVSSSDAASSDSEIKEIVVTAQRREQSVQDVSVSMAVLTGKDLVERGVTDAGKLADSTPNMNFVTPYAMGNPNISIRGVSIGQVFGPTAVSPVGFYYDDVYIGARSEQLGQMFDQDRVEVLRGPQGTLFGRNTNAGAIDVISRKPDDHLEADGSVTYGRFNEIDFEGGVSMPVSDTVSVRLSGVKRYRDGWVTNVNPDAGSPQKVDDVDNWGFRALVQWKPTGDMTWLLNLHGNGNDSTTPVVFSDLGTNTYTGYKPNLAWNQVSLTFPPEEVLNAHGAYLTGNLNFSGLTFTTISAFDRADYRDYIDFDGSPQAIAIDTSPADVTEYSQEFRLAGKSGAFDWVTGAYYYHEDLESPPSYNPAFTDPIFAGQGLSSVTEQEISQISYNYAVFGDVRWAISDTFTLGVGARYTHEVKSASTSGSTQYPDQGAAFINPYDVSKSDNWSAPTGRIVGEWRPVTGVMAYASASRGFKSGGFSADQTLQPYDPEKDNTYEVGIKTTSLDQHLLANLALFYNDLKNLQTLVLLPNPLIPGDTTAFTKNAASGKSKGAEIEVDARDFGGWSFSTSVGLLNTRYDEFQFLSFLSFAGHQFTNSPKATANASAEYKFVLPGGATFEPEARWNYRSHVWFDPHESKPFYGGAGYSTVDLNLPWRRSDGRLTVALWAHNLTDRHYTVYTVGNEFLTAGAAVDFHGDPRTFGVRVGYSTE